MMYPWGNRLLPPQSLPYPCNQAGVVDGKQMWDAGSVGFDMGRHCREGGRGFQGKSNHISIVSYWKDYLKWGTILSVNQNWVD